MHEYGTAANYVQVLSTAVGWIERERVASELSIMMVVGLPNSGKSSLINALKLAARSTGDYLSTAVVMPSSIYRIPRSSCGAASDTLLPGLMGVILLYQFAPSHGLVIRKYC